MELKHVLSGSACMGAHVFLSEVPTSHCLPGKIEFHHRGGTLGPRVCVQRVAASGALCVSETCVRSVEPQEARFRHSPDNIAKYGDVTCEL